MVNTLVVYSFFLFLVDIFRNLYIYIGELRNITLRSLILHRFITMKKYLIFHGLENQQIRNEIYSLCLLDLSKLPRPSRTSFVVFYTNNAQKNPCANGKRQHINVRVYWIQQKQWQSSFVVLLSAWHPQVILLPGSQSLIVYLQVVYQLYLPEPQWPNTNGIFPRKMLMK